MDIKLLVIVFTVGFFAAMWRVLKHPIYGVFSKTSNKQLCMAAIRDPYYWSVWLLVFLFCIRIMQLGELG